MFKGQQHDKLLQHVPVISEILTPGRIFFSDAEGMREDFRTLADIAHIFENIHI